MLQLSTSFGEGALAWNIPWPELPPPLGRLSRPPMVIWAYIPAVLSNPASNPKTSTETKNHKTDMPIVMSTKKRMALTQRRERLLSRGVA